ncbi:hypothetical protein [Spirillospora sp. CA-128828]|uniref:hypothetical protein n=1 Tax=Spirillospora sp. CA-128828 TaxID=3240033 RepID=UPI003D8B3D9B
MREKDLDLRVHDRVALDEIELYAEVLSAAAAADGPLTAAEIDNVLGVRPGHPPRGGLRARTRTAALIGTGASAGQHAPDPAEGQMEGPVQSQAPDLTESRAPSSAVERAAAVSPAQVYRQARRQAAAEQPSLDVRSGLEKLNRWMAGGSGEDSD